MNPASHIDNASLSLQVAELWQGNAKLIVSTITANRLMIKFVGPNGSVPGALIEYHRMDLHEGGLQEIISDLIETGIEIWMETDNACWRLKRA